MDTAEFVLSQLPPAPARVLEIGTGGEGALARVLYGAGYDVVAIDPAAPQEEGIFRRLKIEELGDDERFDAVVAVLTLHHVTDLGPVLDKIRDHLLPGGVLVLEEIGWDRLDEPTADWFYGQQRALAAATGAGAAASLDELRVEWADEHVGLHGYQAMREELDNRFLERFFSCEPFLYRYLDESVATGSLERGLIEADAIQALGWRFVGEALG
ncbi:MAG: class I SAM-dependent methyltransferase [Gaiellaceae bacterium]